MAAALGCSRPLGAERARHENQRQSLSFFRSSSFLIYLSYNIAIWEVYQEQPVLLDPALESMVRPLMAYARDPQLAAQRPHVYQLLYILTKVCGCLFGVRL